MHSKWVDFAFSSICRKTLIQPRQTGSSCNIEPSQTLHGGGTNLPRQEYLSLSATAATAAAVTFTSSHPVLSINSKRQLATGARPAARCSTADA